MALVASSENALSLEVNEGDYFILKDEDEDSVHSSIPHADSHFVSLKTNRGLADQTGFLVICCVVFVGDMNRGILFPLMWPLVDELGGNSVWLGYVVGSFSFGRCIASPVFGKWSIDYGYSKTLLTSSSISVLGSILVACAHNVGSLYFLVFTQVVLGIGSATLGVNRSYVAEITTVKERTKYLALLTAVEYGGFTVTPVLGSFFLWLVQGMRYKVGIFTLDQYSMTACFMATLSAVSITLLLTLFQSRSRITPQWKDDNLAQLRERDELADRRTYFGITVNSAALIGCMMLNMSTKGTIAAFETLGISFAKSYFDLSPIVSGLIVSFCGIIGVFSLLSMGYLGRFLTDIQMIIGGIIVCAIGVVSFAPLVRVEDGGDNALVHYVLGLLMIYGIGYSIGHTAVIGLFSKIVGRRPQGTLQGYFSGAGSLARVLVPIGSGYITHYASMNAMFIVLFINLTIASFLVVTFRRTLGLLSV